MLELKKNGYRSWQWVASGKHPSVKDYISIGRMFPLAASFSEWLSKGYTEQKIKSGSKRTYCSWRFWVKGPAQGEISCGLLRDSSDSIGRPYPLLIMGIGFLEGWERKWELVPLACEDTWSQMERISVQPYAGVDLLEQKLSSLPGPLPDWLSSREARYQDLEGYDLMSPSDRELFCSQVRDLSEKIMGYIVLDPSNDYDRINDVEFVGSVLKQYLENAPSAVFIGGSVGISCFAFFRRPLTVSDFSTLWSGVPHRQKMDTI